MRSIQEIYGTLHNRLVAELQNAGADITDTALGFESPFVLAHAAEFRLMEILAVQLAKEGHPLTANSRTTSEIGMLEYFGEMKDVLRKPSQTGIYLARFSAKKNEDGFIKNGTVIYSEKNIALVILQDLEIKANKTADVEVFSMENGTDFNVTIGEKVKFTQSFTGIEKEGVILSIIQQSKDVEIIEDYKKRIVAAYNDDEQGGTKKDFRIWSQTIPGIITVFPYSAVNYFSNNLTMQKPPYVINTGLGFPTIYIEFENNTPTNEIYSAFLEIISKKASICGGQIQLLPCILKNVSFVFFTQQTLFNFDDIGAECETLVAEYLRQKRPYVEGLDVADNSELLNSEVLFLLNSYLTRYNIVLSAINFRVDSLECSRYKLQSAEIPVFQSIIWS